MLDLRRADAMGERAKRAMRRSVAVAADDRRPRQGEALLGPDDVDDALARIEFVIIFNAEFAGVGRHLLDLEAAFGVLDAARAVGGLDVVVDHRQRLFRRAHPAAGEPQALERLRARHLMDEMAVDIEQRRAFGSRLDDMVVPDFVVERARLGHQWLPRRQGA